MYSRLGRLAAIGIACSLTALAVATTSSAATHVQGTSMAPTIAARVSSSVRTSVSSFPAPPASSAPISQWRSWASQAIRIVDGFPWTSANSVNGCTVSDVSQAVVTSDGQDGIPAGVQYPVTSISGACPAGIQPPANYPGPNDPRTCGSITDGTACVGNTGAGGSLYAQYEYTKSTGSTFGHTELGDPYTGSCRVGTLVANETPQVTLYTNDYGGVSVFYVTNSYWSSTWWQDDGGGHYSSFGTVCALY